MNRITQYWTDPTKRSATIRTLIAVAGYLIHNGTITIPAWVYAIANDPGLLTVVGSLFIPAGEKNKA